MFKIIMVSFAAIAIFTRAVELGMPPILAVVLAAAFGAMLYKLYEYWDKLEKEHEEKKRCARERRLNTLSARNGGTYRSDQSNRSTYARYAMPHSAAERAAKELQSGEDAKERRSSSTHSPIRKVCGELSLDYCRLSVEDRKEIL